jgi:hypothetical protein
MSTTLRACRICSSRAMACSRRRTRKTRTSSCSTPARFARKRRKRCSTSSAAGSRSSNARPELIIGVGGCVASQEGAAIGKRAPYVDLVFGPQTLHRLPEMIDERRSRGLVVDISFPEIEKFDRLPEPSVEGPTAFVSVMEGCSKYCTFCVVPYTRGEEVSRPLGRRHRRGRRPRGPRRARGQPARPERERLPRREPRGRHRRFRRAAAFRGSHSRASTASATPRRTRWSFPTR